jgi:hypothetical protein
MPRVGRLAVDIGLGVDQLTGSLAEVDGQQLTRVTTHRSITNESTIQIADSYVLDVSFQYGRDRFIHGDFETGTATVTLNNDTGEWTPGSGVNAFGGDKLRPGMIVQILYQVSSAQLDVWLEDNTPHLWDGAGTGGRKRDISDAETWTGFVDESPWTAHGSDLEVTVNLSNHPTFGQFSFGYPRFSGRIYSIEDRYEEGGRGAVTVLTLVDYMADLAQINPGALSSPRSAEPATTRMQFGIFSELNTVGQWTNVFLTPFDDFTLEASDLPSNYLEEARVVARAIGGDVFAYHTYYGLLGVQHSNWLVSGRGATVQAVLGTDRIGITSAVTDYSIQRVFNNLIYSNSTTEVTASDATSIAENSTRTLRRTVSNNDATDLQTLADRDLAILKDPKLLIREVTIHPESLFEVDFAMRVECGDLVEVTVLNNGWSYTQLLHVAGISGRWSAADDDWQIRLRLDSREGDSIVAAAP